MFWWRKPDPVPVVLERLQRLHSEVHTEALLSLRKVREQAANKGLNGGEKATLVSRVITDLASSLKKRTIQEIRTSQEELNFLFSGRQLERIADHAESGLASLARVLAGAEETEQSITLQTNVSAIKQSGSDFRQEVLAIGRVNRAKRTEPALAAAKRANAISIAALILAFLAFLGQYGLVVGRFFRLILSQGRE